jgi:hypothetical protein
MRYGWLVFTCALVGAVNFNFFVSRQILHEGGLFVQYLSIFLPKESIFNSEYFANALLRSTVALSGIIIVLLATLVVPRVDAKTILSFFRPKLIPLMLLCGILLYLHPLENIFADFPYTPAIFVSILLVVVREHFYFFSQQWFSEDGLGVLIGGGVALLAFIWLHPLILNEARILATAMMINLWIYTVCERNMWMGVSVHALWNFVMPENTMFYYAVFVFTCFLAFGRPSYPKFLVPSWALKRPAFQKFASVWRIFWSYPEQMWGELRAALFRTSD